ncbi:MAG: cysteine desulfurase [Prolixibacteraceae bacterium]|nr:cysteine desulfurase [Prolixibacteraceae bacterium]
MTPKFPIYMDYHATTPVDPRVLESMLPFFSEQFGNASSIDHLYGVQAAEVVESAREKTAKIIHARSDEIIFTSGATESDNLAILGVMDKFSEKGDHLITCVTEHKAVLDTAKKLQEKGKSVTFLSVDQYGMVDPGDVVSALTDKTVLISIMAANNEIGTIAPLNEIGKIAHDNEVLFHTDAAQAVGHIPIDVNKMNIDLLSMSGHKIYGPKGVGALFIKGRNPKGRLTPQLSGGGQERGVRSGTLNVPGIVGLGTALEIAGREMKDENVRFRKWTSQMYQSFCEFHDDVKLNGHRTNRLAHNLNVSFGGIESKALLHLIQNDLAISAGSACTTTSVEPSHVLKAIGLSEKYLFSAVRFGAGRFNSEGEIEIIIEKIDNSLKKIRNIKI